MARRPIQRAAARQRTNLVPRRRPGAVLGDRLRARRLRMESLENRCLLAGDALASIELVVVDSQGMPLTHVEVGDAFVLQGIVRDLRASGSGVFAAYTDVTFDAALASASAPLVRASAFSGGLPEHSASQGEYTEVGGFRPQGDAGEVGDAAGEVFFSIPLVAGAPGELLFAANPADLLPSHDVLLFGLDEYVAQDQIAYGFVRLQVGDPNDASPSPWRNPANPSDVNNDGAVDALDVQQVQAELDHRAGQTGLDPAQAGQPPYFDVTGDRLVTPDDLAAVQRQLPAARPAPEEPDDDATEWLIERIGPWLDFDWQVELRVTKGFEPVTSARVGDILHVHAILHVPEEASSSDVDKLLPMLSRNILPAFTQTALAYDPTKLQLVDSLERRDAYAYERSLIDPTLDPAARLDAFKRIVEGEHWLVGASFVVLEDGVAPFSTLPEGTEPGVGLGIVPSGAEINETFASRIEDSVALQEFGEELSSKVQHTAATVNLSAAGTRPTVQNDTYDLTNYYGELMIDQEHGVLANDAGGDGARALLVQEPTHGSVTLNADGSIRYVYDFERLGHVSDTFAYVVVNADGTSEFAEVDIRADNVPPIAEVSVQAIDGLGRPLESVHVGQEFFLQAVVTDLRPDGVGPGSNARGANDAFIDVAFSSDTLKVNGPVVIHNRFGGTEYVPAWSTVGPDEVRVRGRSDLRTQGPKSGALEVFRVRVQATAAGTGVLTVDNARVDLRPGLIDIPESLVRFKGFTLDVQLDPSTLRPWSNPQNALDVTGDGHIVAADALDVINYLNSLGGGPVSATLPAGQAYLDADADNFITASDALAVINHLNSRRNGAEGESTSPPASPASEPSAIEADLLMLLASDLATENGRRR